MLTSNFCEVKVLCYTPALRFTCQSCRFFMHSSQYGRLRRCIDICLVLLRISACFRVYETYTQYKDAGLLRTLCRDKNPWRWRKRFTPRGDIFLYTRAQIDTPDRLEAHYARKNFVFCSPRHRPASTQASVVCLQRNDYLTRLSD